ncbi:alpha-N-acetylglucosaminidase [Streptomyces sp. NPDC086023]|uniref:alpha-N-acetylglucosaminidase n=1 Tax=Streptomyces sp. NPDC086023 TaxID=3365746 RepID=UPI0037D42B25
MRLTRTTLAAALLCLLGSAAAPATGAPAARPAAPAAPDAPATTARARAAFFDDTAAEEALLRLLPEHAGQITLFPAARSADGKDGFTVSGKAGRITVRATSPATMLTGVGWYLQHVAKVDIGWPGDSLGRLPKRLPAVPAAVTRTALVPHRYALNDTDDGYSGAYRTFADHERQIDLLALHGINEVFVQVGAEYPYYKALQRYGYTAEELRAWIPGPAHQGWWLLQNLSAFGGPVTERLLTERAELGRRITDRLRSLGMTPVLPGYFGTVPPGFAARNPGAKVVPQGDWSGFDRPDWLDPAGPVFAELATDYYTEQRAAFGDSTMYRMSPLHEGGSVGGVDVKAGAAAVQAALHAAHPGALWAVLGWQDDPTKDLLAGVDTSRLLIIDGLSDRYNKLDRETRWANTPYALGTIPNFGGHTTIGANTGVWLTRFREWREKAGSRLSGIAYLPEATGTDPAAYDLFTDLAWEPGPLDHERWFADYARRRYGGEDAQAAAAWEALRKGPYDMASGFWSEPQDSLFTARPSLTVSSSCWSSPRAMRYPAASVETALKALLAVDPRLRGSSAYHYDLVDVARQALANRSRVLLPQIKAAYEGKNPARFRELVGQWQEHERMLAAVTGSDRNFLLGPRLAAARSWGTDQAEKDRYEYDVRSLLTTWGPHATSEVGLLHDYANREWAGMLEEFYAARWKAYFTSLEEALVSGEAPEAIDWFAFEDAWARKTTAHPTEPSGDAHALATAIAEALT